MVGKTVAHYEIEDHLGEGGSGVVYRGRDLRLERLVAIKVLADQLRDDELAWARLLREARLASHLNHPHIGAIYDLGEEDDRAYIVMEYIEGLPLSDLIPEGGMPLEQVRRYGAQIAEALAYAHERGVIHGDLKGSNILVTSEGNIKLLDFGLGRRIPRSGMAEVTSSRLPLAEAGATAGTLPYLAPEVLRGDATSLQSDAWALGVLLYQMVTGELPFQGATTFELSVEIMVGTPQRLAQVAEPLQSILRRCLEKDPAARCAQVREVMTALASDVPLAEPLAQPPAASAAVTPTTASGQPAKAVAPRGRRKWLAAGGAATLVVLLAVIFAWHGVFSQNSPAKSPESEVHKAFGTGNPEVKVWVNMRSGTYHCPGTTWYGNTQQGEYMTQKEAQDKGYRPAADRACR
jgi:predicted Ser/Thr protein kinase